MNALAQSGPSYSKMACEPAERCALCGGKGVLLHSGLKDYLFGFEGSWNIRECVEEKCGLFWIDPIPVQSELWKVYRNYYTHPGGTPQKVSRNRFRRWAYSLYDFTVGLTPIARQRRELKYMFLDSGKPGRLLEIGCGDGSRLALFRDAGWAVEGVEVDAEAAKFASERHRIPVRHGELHSLRYTDGHFDAVIMNHVLEHVYDPIALLTECFRLVRSGGSIISVTPNSNSFGYSQFKQYWIGLDPPRHLHVFNSQNLLRLVENIPARRREVWTSAANAELICGWSLRTWDEQQNQKRFLTRLPRMISVAILQYAAAFRHFVDRSSGEECILRLVK